MKEVHLIEIQERNLHLMDDYVTALQMILNVVHLQNIIALMVTVWPDNIIPATLDIYAFLFRSGSFEEYIETIFRIWTFVLRWKRHNYNKAPLAFLLDILYWQDTNHPFVEVIKLFLVHFNDYFVKNMHSKICTHTFANSTAENIIKQAYIINEQGCEKLKNTFEKMTQYLYKLSILELLTEKTVLFLLDYFHKLFIN
ncbi:hypothetical protein Glove_59g62 [Diversispora epigaea]|uniref:Uncharacterized protein n=1 Tax=Diversispora epigaea TaxID=1348612 RepID=A0A397JKY5_9GLOM|nr:hypothetical protein Glove_59g62 [Diversispora epigaea]